MFSIALCLVLKKWNGDHLFAHKELKNRQDGIMNHRYSSFYVLVLLLMASIIALSGCSPQPEVCFGDTCFMIDLAQTPKERQNGLMHKTAMDPDKGMLFLFDEEKIYSFWMKNTLIPLDMVWLDNNDTVVYIQRHAQPCNNDDRKLSDTCPTYTPDRPALFVVEVNAGMLPKEVTVGSTAEIIH